jgi:hypothetical protein
MKLRVYPTGQVTVSDKVTEGSVTLSAYSAEERVIALRFVEPLTHRGIPVPEFTVAVYRVYRVLSVSETDVVTVIDFPIMEWLDKPHGAQFGPTLF